MVRSMLILFEGRWVSPEDMRRDAAKADRFLAWYYR